MSRKSSTETIVAAMRVLARDIESGDGVASAAIAEAADRMAEQQARIAELEKLSTKLEAEGLTLRATQREPFAWATFDGEGSYDLRLYECNESYRDEWIAANGRLYADWVIPLYEAPDELRGRIAELECQAAIGRRAVAALYAIEWPTSRLTGSRYCPVCGHCDGHDERCELAAILRDAEQANNRVILDSSDHVRGATEMVADRQLAGGEV